VKRFVKRFLKRFPLRWDWYDWSLSLITTRWPDGAPHELTTLFSLVCWHCRRFNVGRCDEHWFCEMCNDCRREIEAEEPA
jgi:hypothetical protein